MSDHLAVSNWDSTAKSDAITRPWRRYTIAALLLASAGLLFVRLESWLWRLLTN